MDKKINQSFFERFLHSQVSGSIVLIIATILAIVWANSPFKELYHNLSHLDIGVVFAKKTYQMGLAHWIKDGLMTIFFFVVGLEIKREVLLGELSSLKDAALPVFAAVGGCLFPALIYYFFNSKGITSSGWGIPMATDIAFAIGILSLLGNRVPIGLKVFLTALAIVDDLIAVLVIAFFYTSQIHLISLIWAAIFLGIFYLSIKLEARRPIFYLGPAIGVWASFMFSGIHATIAGVLLALLIPVTPKSAPEDYFEAITRYYQDLRGLGKITRKSLTKNKRQWQLVEKIYLASQDMLPPGVYLEEYLHPVQAFVVLPLFALFAAGVTINHTILEHFPGSLSLGIIFGLCLGKPLGIFLFSWISVISRIADLPKGISIKHIFGAGCLGGIGFTMSIFISELCFTDNMLVDEAKLSIFIASILAGVSGFVFLKIILKDNKARDIT